MSVELVGPKSDTSRWAPLCLHNLRHASNPCLRQGAKNWLVARTRILGTELKSFTSYSSGLRAVLADPASSPDLKLVLSRLPSLLLRLLISLLIIPSLSFMTSSRALGFSNVL